MGSFAESCEMEERVEGGTYDTGIGLSVGYAGRDDEMRGRDVDLRDSDLMKQ